LDFHKQLEDDNAFYLIDSERPTSPAFAYTLLFSLSRSERWNNFVKTEGHTIYYMPIWSPDEIWALWNLEYKNLSKDCVQTLMNWWGPIPRIIFDKYKDEPNVNSLISKCKS